MSYRDAQRLADVLAPIEAVRSHPIEENSPMA